MKNAKYTGDHYKASRAEKQSEEIQTFTLNITDLIVIDD